MTTKYSNTGKWQGKLQQQWASFQFVVQELLLLDSIMTFLSFLAPSVKDSPGKAEICFSQVSDKLMCNSYTFVVYEHCCHESMSHI